MFNFLTESAMFEVPFAKMMSSLSAQQTKRLAGNASNLYVTGWQLAYLVSHVQG